MGQTRVDLQHLLEDLRDAYPGDLEETILTEIAANSLDSGATSIALTCNAAAATLTVVDDGSGMHRRELSRYHDVASSTKHRGQGIGFAGVGIKLALLLCEDVITETKRGKSHVASRWRLASRYKAPWKWEAPPGLVADRGTAVRMRVTNPLSPLLDPGFVESVLLRHYRPHHEPDFRPILAEHYRAAVRFTIDGRYLPVGQARATERAPIQVRLPRRRKPSAVGYLIREPLPLPEDDRGVAISTLGKVIKRGWDWLGITPASPERIGGIIETPALAECLTLNKADFIRSGARGATFLAYRKAIQEAVSRQLAAWGDYRESGESPRRRAARPVERDLERVLVDLADEFPLVAALVERREGGQRKLPMGGGEGGRQYAPGLALATEEPGQEPPIGEAAPAGDDSPPEAPSEQEQARERATPTPEPPATSISLPSAKGSRRPGRYGLTIQFESRKDSADLARLIESTVWVNDAHPAFLRAAASRSEGYHIALSVAMALAPLAVEREEEREFLTAFLDRWGRALPKRSRSRRGPTNRVK